MRRPFTRADLARQGVPLATLRYRLRTGSWTRIASGVFLDGDQPPTEMERAVGLLVAVNDTASHSLAGRLHQLDSTPLGEPLVTVPLNCRSKRAGLRRRNLHPSQMTTVDGYPCTSGMQTMIDLAAVVDDLVWEQALESALRKRLTTVTEIKAQLPVLRAARTAGASRIKRVLSLQPEGLPHTESLLETLMVQAIRKYTDLPEPSRQVEVVNRWGQFTARVDLAWPQFGVFIELDGQHHLDQPEHDARRETAVVATTGWLPGRFTWREVVNAPKSTARRCAYLVDAAQALRAS